MRFALKLLVAIIASYVLAFWISVSGNPEIGFWRKVGERREALLEEIRASNPDAPVVLFTGGSSTAFSVDPLIVAKECGIPAVNLGLPAGVGPRFMIDRVLSSSRPGDIVVAGLEPDFFTDSVVFPPNTLAFGLALAEGAPSSSVGGDSFGRNLGLSDWLTLPRPGARYLLTLAFRTSSGEGYRYTMEDFREGGRLETAIRMPQPEAHDIVAPRKISLEGQALLQEIRAAAADRQVRVFYTMPWLLATPESAGPVRSANRLFLGQIDRILPVLEDPSAGVSTDPDHFSDSNLHLTGEGSRIRSLELGIALRTALSRESQR